MALLPVLLDMVDEIYSSLDNPQNTVGDIPLLFVPHGRRGDRECPRRREHGHMRGHHGPGHGHGHGHGHKHKEGHSSSDEEQKHCKRKEKCGKEGGHCRLGDFRGANYPYQLFGRCPRYGGRCNPCKKTLTDEFKVAFDVKAFNAEEVSVKVKGREVFVEGKHDERTDEHGFVSRQFTRRFIVPDEYDIDTVATYLDSDGKMTITASKPKPVTDESSERIIPIERVASVQDEINEALAAVDLTGGETTDLKMDEKLD